MNKNKNKAFTLIELLLVSGIVSLLASVILFNVSEGKSKAEDGRMKVESSQVIAAIEMYKSDHNGFTPLKVTSSSATGNLYTENETEYKNAMQAIVDAGYLPSIPRSPDGQSYTYGENSDGTSAIFVAKLKNNSSTKTKDSCGIVDTSDVTYSSCQEYYTPQTDPLGMPTAVFTPPGSLWCPSGFTNCTDYMNANPGKFCFDGYKADFCTIYGSESSGFCPVTVNENNLNGELSAGISIVDIGGGGSGLLPGSTYTPSVCEAIICNAPTEQPLCGGNNTNDYCSCI